MKNFTKQYTTGILYLCYSVWDGNMGIEYVDFASARVGAREYNSEVEMCGFFHNPVLYCSEEVDSKEIAEDPTLYEKQEFLNKCINLLK